MTARSVLILGGARSGKTGRALTLAEAYERKIYIATAEALDDEMADRIARHRRERGEDWRTIEAPLQLPRAIAAIRDSGAICIVDCLTLWLSNLIGAERDVEVATAELCRAIESAAPVLAIVSNELGLGLVPETALGRRFRDEHGRLNQAVARIADRVELVVAGLPLQLKPAAPAG